MVNPNDPRVSKTRSALIEAFNCLILDSGQHAVRVAEIIRRADVGRSTFYDHYANIDAIHREAISKPLDVLADAVHLGIAGHKQLVCLLNHFDENRYRAQQAFAKTSFRDQATLVLAECLQNRLRTGLSSVQTKTIPPELDASISIRLIAETAMALIRIWITNEISCSTETLATTMLKATHLLMNANCKDSRGHV